MTQKSMPRRLAAQNRRAHHDYHIQDTVEAGLVLAGSEVKSIRAGRATITESYAGAQGGELWLFSAYLPEYQAGPAAFGQSARRPRKLLLRRREAARLMGAIQRDGVTLIALDFHFSDRGMAKVMLGLGRGKSLHDKRESDRKHSWERDRSRLLRGDR